MEELIAKRYIKALIEGEKSSAIEGMAVVFSTLAVAVESKELSEIINNPDVKSADKAAILLDAVKKVKSDRINNLIKLLAENKRLSLIPAMAEQLRKTLADSTKQYQGVVYSNAKIDNKLVSQLSDGLSKKFDSKITLSYEKDDFDGIKVNVDDLGVEINFSKERINSQMIEHILKAI